MRLYGHELIIDWEGLTLGRSFFVPCIDRVSMARKLRKEAFRQHKEVLVKERIENGILGCRVWLIANENNGDL